MDTNLVHSGLTITMKFEAELIQTYPRVFGKGAKLRVELLRDPLFMRVEKPCSNIRHRWHNWAVCGKIVAKGEHRLLARIDPYQRTSKG